MDETKLTAIEAWATQAIAEYGAEIATGEPPYPQMAADVLELVREFRVLHDYSDMQAARLRKTVNQPQQACPQCLGRKTDPLHPDERCGCCGGTGSGDQNGQRAGFEALFPSLV